MHFKRDVVRVDYIELTWIVQGRGFMRLEFRVADIGQRRPAVW